MLPSLIQLVSLPPRLLSASHEEARRSRQHSLTHPLSSPTCIHQKHFKMQPFYFLPFIFSPSCFYSFSLPSAFVFVGIMWWCTSTCQATNTWSAGCHIFSSSGSLEEFCSCFELPLCRRNDLNWSVWVRSSLNEWITASTVAVQKLLQ